MATPLKMAQCPYNPSHRIDPRKLSMHIVKCGRNNKHMRMETCPFNATHVVPTHKFKAHILDCPDNDAVLRSIVNHEVDNTSSDSSLSDSEENVSIRTGGGSGGVLTGDGLIGGQMDDTEEWGADHAGPIKQTGYDPKLASFMKPFVRMVPSGLGRSARNSWWQMERERVRQLQEGVPFSHDVRAAFDIPDHLDTELPFVLLSGSLPSTSGLNTASTSCQLGPERNQQPMRRPRISNPACPPSYAAILLQQQQKQQQERQLQHLHEHRLKQDRREKEAQKPPIFSTQQQLQEVVQDKQKTHMQDNRGPEGDPMSVVTRSSEMPQRKVLQPPAMVNRARLLQNLVSRPLTNVARPPPLPTTTSNEPLLQQQLETQPLEQQQQHVTDNRDQLRLQTKLEEVMRNNKELQSENDQLRDRLIQMSLSMQRTNQGGSAPLSNDVEVETPVSSGQASVDRAATVHVSGIEQSSVYQQDQAEDPRAARDHLHNPNRQGDEEAQYYNDAPHYNVYGENYSKELVDEHMLDDLSVQDGCSDAQREPSMDEEDKVLDLPKCEAVKKPATANRVDYDSYKNSVADRIAHQILSRSALSTGDSDRDSSIAGSQPSLSGAGNMNSVARRTKGSSSNINLRGSSKSLYQSSEGKLHVCGSQGSLNEFVDHRGTSRNSSFVGSRGSLDAASDSGPRCRAPAPGASNEGRRSTGHASWADAARGPPANPTSCPASALAGREDSKSLQTAIKNYRKNAAEAKGGEGSSGPSSSGLLRGVGRGILNPNWAVSRNGKGKGGKGNEMASANRKM